MFDTYLDTEYAHLFDGTLVRVIERVYGPNADGDIIFLGAHTEQGFVGAGMIHYLA